jgi:hypothetical protein
MNKLMLVLFFLLLPLNLSAFPYVCVMENAVGFNLNKETGNWFNAKFRIDKKNFLISKSKNSKYIAEIKEFGSEDAIAHCGHIFRGHKEEDVKRLLKYGWLHCSNGSRNNVRVNVKTLKIIMSYFGGYGVENEMEYGDSPVLEIGSCSPL